MYIYVGEGESSCFLRRYLELMAAKGGDWENLYFNGMVSRHDCILGIVYCRLFSRSTRNRVGGART